MKLAKQALAVVLALLMAFSMFSIVGSASALNPATTADPLWSGAGTITYGIDVYKVDGNNYTKVTSGSYLAPGDVVEVRVSFGTNFVTGQVCTLIFYDTKYFVPYQNGAPKTEKDGKIFEGFAKTYEDAVPTGTLATDGSEVTFYTTLSAAGGLMGAVNSYMESDSQNDRNKYYPDYMREGYGQPGVTIKNTTPVDAKYADLAYTYASFNAGSDSTLSGALLTSVPYATYYSFQMQVIEGADSEGETTAIFIPALAQKTKKADQRNKLFGGTSSTATYGTTTVTLYGQGIDATNADFEAIIGLPAHEHTFGEGVVTTEPTCTAKGVKTFTCTDPDCDKSEGWQYTEEIDALGHDYAAEVTDPTCTDGGYTTYTCSRCGDTYTGDETDPLGHDYNAEVTAPTCTDGGYTTYTCSRCGDSYTGDETDPLGHNWGSWTSYDDEYHTRSCTRCGTPDALSAHVITLNKEKSVAATLELDGLNVYGCTLCEYEYSEVVPHLDHEHQYASVVTDPTCTAGGYTTYTCSVCGDTYTDDETDPLGHDYAAEVTEPTCTAGGYTTYTCSRCGDTYTGDETDALGHDYAAEVTEPTCTAGGFTTYTCSRCGDSYTADETDALGHAYLEDVIEPTCTEGGYTTYTCSRCGDTYTADETDALGHAYAAEVTEPTCLEGGYTTYTCSRCGDSYTADETDALGHDYAAAVTAPSCTAGGYTTYTCSRCGDSYTGDETDALGHSYNAVVTEPTCTAGGYTTYTCSRCGDTYTADETDALGHDYAAAVTAPTCTAGGFTTYTCSRCGDSYTGDETAALGHSWDEGTFNKATNETVYTCTRCGETYAEAAELTLTESAQGQEGQSVRVTVPYARKGAAALTLTASADNVTFKSSNEKVLKVDENGVVRFQRLSLFNRSATITATASNGKEAVCEINIQIEWWQYLVWLILGTLWF